MQNKWWEKKYQSGDVALHPLPSAWTIDTHTRPLHITLVFQSATGEAVMCDMLLKTSLILSSSIHIAQALPCPASLSSWEKHQLHTFNHHATRNLVSVEIQHTSTSCTAFCWLQRNNFTYFQQIFFFVTLHLYTVKSTFTDFRFTASTCVFTMAGWMVNKRWTCSRIKTLKWLLNSTHWSQTDCDVLLVTTFFFFFHFYWLAAAFWLKKKKNLKQNKTNKQQKKLGHQHLMQ